MNIKLKAKLKLLSIFIFLQYFCFAQNLNQKKNDSSFFKKGIYLENLNILIPWKIDFTRIKEYGNPSVFADPDHGGRTVIQWDSVKVLDSILLLNLRIQKPARYFKKNELNHVMIFNASIDSISAEKLTSYFVKYSNKPGTLTVKKKVTKKLWLIDECLVIVGKGTEYGYFLSISKLPQSK